MLALWRSQYIDQAIFLWKSTEIEHICSSDRDPNIYQIRSNKKEKSKSDSTYMDLIYYLLIFQILYISWCKSYID